MPTPEEVRAGVYDGVGTWGHGGLSSGALTVPAADTVATVNVTNLTYIGGNDLWVVAASTSGALQPYVSLLAADTRDMSAPAFLPIGADTPTPALYVGAVAVDVAGHGSTLPLSHSPPRGVLS